MFSRNIVCINREQVASKLTPAEILAGNMAGSTCTGQPRMEYYLCV